MSHPQAVRAAVEARWQRWLPLLARHRVQQLWRLLVWAFWLLYFGFVLLVLALRYSILPNIERYRTDIERLASGQLGLTISIGRVEASWQGLNPDLTLLDVRVADSEGRPALAFSRVEAVLSWWSVPSAQLKLQLLSIDEPTVNIRRDADGLYSVAGIPVQASASQSGAADWVLAQRHIRIRGATLLWEDELRDAPPLILEDLNFALDNDGRNHRFGLTALPPTTLAAPLDVRGAFKGRSFETLAAWSGQLYAEIGDADLAGWRRWVDYPLALTRGRGALRAWVDVAAGRPAAVTADLLLRGVDVRLAEDLPVLDLASASGRIDVRFAANGLELNGQRFALTAIAAPGVAAAPLQVEPTNFHVVWQTASDSKGNTGAFGRIGTVSDANVGSVTADSVDLGALARLAEYLPILAQVRRQLDEYAPQGRVTGLAAKWKGSPQDLQSYALQAAFSRLALKAHGELPGFSGLAGSVEVNEKGGTLTLNAQKSSLDLPTVFPVSLIELDALKGQARWKLDKGGLDLELAYTEFAGADAAGSAQGHYHYNGSGPGVIDLSAALTRADARSVWRYMPHVVDEAARRWLRDALLGGSSNEAKLILKGDLRDFPFLDKRKGQFLVTVKARDVILDYGKGWPRIEGIYGDLRFEGNGMVVQAQRGTLLGARLSNTRAEIPDFDTPLSTLSIKGNADGPTAEFLKFIDQSPVAERIDRFTEDMRATGNGHLDLNLSIPLDEAKLADSKIDGGYTFKNNDVTVDAGLPPVRQVSGTLKFSGSELRIPEINGNVFGGPIKIKGGTQKDGKVLINASGVANFAQLRKQVDGPLLNNLSGNVPYRGDIQVNKRDADLVIDSTLVGLASALPEPLAKVGSEPLPLHFEKKLLPAVAARGRPGETVVRDQIGLTLGNLLSVQVVRRKQSGGFVAERGALAIGQPLQMPSSGFALAVSAKQLDLDAWRKLLPEPAAGAASATPALPDTITLHTPDLLVFGRRFKDVDLSANTTTPGQVKLAFSSSQAGGDLIWESAGHGKLSARLKKLALESSDESLSTAAAKDVDDLKELPALDVVADEFSVGARRFGRLELEARNEGGVWRLDQVRLSNSAGEFSGSGEWRIGGGRNRTLLNFKLTSNDVGKLLDRVGYPGTMRGGTALLDGKLGWNGAPVDLDYASLSGEMTLDAGKGQFLKLDPGAAGKLLGLVSLQGLPRRITLDFRDVFSKGLAYDSMASKVTVHNGVLHTDKLQIDSTSARVLMHGDVDLQRETQTLYVNVQPELGGTAALGVALVNPVAGVATWLAHKVLQNPLNHIFGFNYLVTGSWDDPKVDKVAAGDPSLNQPAPTDAGGAAEAQGGQ